MEYIYPVVCVSTAEELFCKTRSSSGSISTLVFVLILQSSSSTRQGAPVGVYLPCCVCKYSRGALLQDKEHQWEYIYPVVCVNTAEELFYTTRSTSGSIPTLFCVNTAEELFYTTRSTSRSIPTLLYEYSRVALLQDKEHQLDYIYPVGCGNTAEELFYTTRSTSRSIPTLLCFFFLYCRGVLHDKEHQ